MVDVALAVSRWLQLGAAVLVFGVPAFLAYALKPGMDGAHRRWSSGILIGGVAAALAASMLMLMAQSAEMGGDGRYAFDIETVWAVVTETQFGTIWMFRTLTLIVLGALVIFGSRQWMTIVVGAVIAGSLAWLGHGGEGGPTFGGIHRAADVVHTLAASFWIGALVVLVRLSGRDDAMELLHGLRRFSGIGVAIVAVLVLTGIINAWAINGDRPWSASIGTSYAFVLGIKLLIFSLMLVIAIVNRVKFTPDLARASGSQASTAKVIAVLRASVGIETVLAFLVLLAVAALGVMEPPSAG